MAWTGLPARLSHPAPQELANVDLTKLIARRGGLPDVVARLACDLERPRPSEHQCRRRQLSLIVSLGILASGGSSFWNSVLTYLLAVKDLMAASATEAKRKMAAPSANMAPKTESGAVVAAAGQ
jgi:hypothetical protein